MVAVPQWNLEPIPIAGHRTVPQPPTLCLATAQTTAAAVIAVTAASLLVSKVDTLSPQTPADRPLPHTLALTRRNQRQPPWQLRLPTVTAAATPLITVHRLLAVAAGALPVLTTLRWLLRSRWLALQLWLVLLLPCEPDKVFAWRESFGDDAV